MKQVLITGGAGFIGTHLCRHLVKTGVKVKALDLVAPKHQVTGVTYIKGDARNPETVKNAIQDTDTVYHLAALVSVPLCEEKPVESHEHNLMATLIVAEAVKQESERRKHKVRLIFSGSSVVYGLNGKPGRALTETDTCTTPISLYGAQKIGSEHVIQIYRKNFSIPAVIFRFFNVYGPDQDPSSPYSGVISIFTSKLKNGEPLQLNGGGTQTRDFVSVHDVVKALVLAGQADESRCDANPMNLGTGQSVTIRTLAETMMKLLNRQVALKEAPPRINDVPDSMANIDRAKKTLQWEPAVSLEQGLQELFHG